MRFATSYNRKTFGKESIMILNRRNREYTPMPNSDSECLTIRIKETKRTSAFGWLNVVVLWQPLRKIMEQYAKEVRPRLLTSTVGSSNLYAFTH